MRRSAGLVLALVLRAKNVIGSVDMSSCNHVWEFTTPFHIRCAKCPAIGQRWPTDAERMEHKSGKWIYLSNPSTRTNQ